MPKLCGPDTQHPKRRPPWTRHVSSGVLSRMAAHQVFGASGAEPKTWGSMGRGAVKDVGTLVKARGHGPGDLQPIDQPLDLVPAGIASRVKGGGARGRCCHGVGGKFAGPGVLGWCA